MVEHLLIQMLRNSDISKKRRLSAQFNFRIEISLKDEG